MAALNELNGFKPSWLKWHILVAVGTPIVIGIGYWYVLKRNKQIGSKETKKEEKIKENTIHRPTVEKDFSKEVKVLSPLERAQELKNSGNKLYLAKMYDDAIRCYTEAIEICPKEEKDTLSTYYQNRAAAYEQKNILEDVIKDCTSALEYNPRYTKALQRRAKATERNGNLEQSLQDVTAVCILENFTNNNSLITADKILKQLGRQHAKEQMLKQKLVMPSKHFVKSYLSSFSNNPLLPLNKSHINGHVNTEIPLSELELAKEILHSGGDCIKVVQLCTSLLEDSEIDVPEALLLRATTYILRGQHELALDDLENIINNSTCDKKIKVNALIKRATLYIQKEQIEKCFEDFALAEKIDPENSDVYHHRGQVYLLLDKITESLADFKAAVERSPDFPLAVVQHQYVEYKSAVIQGDSSRASTLLSVFKNLTEKFPQCIEVFTLYAQVLLEKQDYEEADKQFQRAVLIDPQNAQIRVHRGLLHLQWKGDVELAIKIINDAIALDENCEFCYETLGSIEVQRGNLSKAIELFEKAIQLAKTELEMGHLFSLKDAAVAQKAVTEKLGISLTLPFNL